MTNFFNALAWVWVVFYLLGLGVVFYEFSKLTPLQQELTQINLNSGGTICFVVSVTWLIFGG